MSLVVVVVVVHHLIKKKIIRSHHEVLENVDIGVNFFRFLKFFTILPRRSSITNLARSFCMSNIPVTSNDGQVDESMLPSQLRLPRWLLFDPYCCGGSNEETNKKQIMIDICCTVCELLTTCRGREREREKRSTYGIKYSNSTCTLI